MQRRLASGFAAGVGGFGGCVGADGGNMDQLFDPGRRRGATDAAGCQGVNLGEALAAFLVNNAGQIHHLAGALDGARHRIIVAHIGLHQCDLTDAAHAGQETGQFRAPQGDPQQRPFARQFLDDMAPEKTGAAENRNDAFAHGAAAFSFDAST